MGDRTSVSLLVMKDDAEKIYAKIIELYGEADRYNDTEEVEFTLEEINYGELAIQEWSKKEGIPYSYRWNSGCGYGSGWEHLRFDEKGKPVFIEFDDNELELDPKNVAEQLVKSKHQKDVQDSYLTLYNFLKPFVENFIPLEWETQHHNKRIARTVNLLTG